VMHRESRGRQRIDQRIGNRRLVFHQQDVGRRIGCHVRMKGESRREHSAHSFAFKPHFQS